MFASLSHCLHVCYLMEGIEEPFYTSNFSVVAARAAEQHGFRVPVKAQPRVNFAGLDQYEIRLQCAYIRSYLSKTLPEPEHDYVIAKYGVIRDVRMPAIDRWSIRAQSYCRMMDRRIIRDMAAHVFNRGRTGCNRISKKYHVSNAAVHQDISRMHGECARVEAGIEARIGKYCDRNRFF